MREGRRLVVLTMPLETLDFEQPIAVLLKEISALRLLPRSTDREQEIAALDARLESVRREVYAKLTPWQQVLVARHPSRPHTLDFERRSRESRPCRRN